MFVIRKVLLALAIYLAAYWLYGQVLSATQARVVALVLALAELFAPMIVPTGRTGMGAGGSIRALLSVGVTFAIWPILAIGLDYVGMVDRPARIALAAAMAATLGVFAARHGSGRDSLRMQTVLMTVAIPLFAMGQALTCAPLDPLAVALACGGVAVALLVARRAIVWPKRHDRAAMTLAGASLTAGVFCALHWVI
jgi:hypothetical protein